MNNFQTYQRLKKAADIVVNDCLRIKKHEKVVIITDECCREIGYALWYSLKFKTNAIIMEIPKARIHGEEPPKLVAEMMKRSDVFIIPTSKSLTHTRARIEANRAGARGVTMPGITAEVMKRTLNADYKKISRLTNDLAILLSQANSALIKTEKGTELTLVLEKRRGHRDAGIVTKPKDFSNLPAGEAYIAPVENRTNGIILIDGSFAPLGLLPRPVTLKIEKGEITGIRGNRQLMQLFGKYGKKERTLCEFGIGTNYKAKITGNVLEDEKSSGSVHFAFGNNLGFGGCNDARIHLDAVLKNPSVWLDGCLIIEKGNYLH